MIFIINFKKRYSKLIVFIIVIYIVSVPLIHIKIANNNYIQTNTSISNSVKVPIIMYHIILKDNAKKNNYTVTPKQFEEDLKYIKEHGYTTVVMEDLIKYVYEGKSLPDKPIILTFDDGFYNNYYYAYPLLKEYEMRAVISIVGSYTDEATEINEKNPNYSYLMWDDIKEISDLGIFEIQNHSYNLHDNKFGSRGSKKKIGEYLEEYKIRLSEDLNKVQKGVYEKIGKYPTTFTYPFGSVSKESTNILKDANFFASLGCEEGVNIITKNNKDCLFLLKRYNRKSGMLSQKFFDKIE